jgi:hypothetical protein
MTKGLKIIANNETSMDFLEAKYGSFASSCSRRRVAQPCPQVGPTHNAKVLIMVVLSRKLNVS